MKKLIYIIAIGIIFLIFPLLSACQKMKTYSITYVCSEGGTIIGQENQSVPKGESANSVTAIPDEGYKFVKWSDGVRTAQRIDNNITKDMTITAYFEKLAFYITYYAANGGTIEGPDYQYVEYGDNSTEVIAVPNENYKFIGWSDGYNETNRSDKNVTESKSYTAMFEKIGTLFNLVYNNATENADIPSIRVYYDSIKDAIFPIPQRINSTFEGWYLDKDFTTQVTDKDGKLLDDNLVYDYDIENLYAKFSLIEDVSYKILMVYVTAVKGTFETYHGDFVSIDYKMSEVEKTLCKMITDKFAQTLNEMFAGLVRFEVDSYFTTEVIGAESFTVESSFSHGNFDYSLDAYKIPELNNSELLDNYRSVLTTVPLEMDGEDGINPPYKLHSSYGVSEQKYACLYWECIAGSYIIGTQPLAWLRDPTNKNYNSAWDIIMTHYTNEFCHTIEKQISGLVLYDINKTFRFYLTGTYPITAKLDVIKLFLLNQAQDNEGVKYGIPYDFWNDSIKFNDTIWVHYISAIDNKLVDVHAEKLLYKDFLSTTLYIPEIEGYEFEGWFLDQEYTLPIGDKYGNVTEDDYKIFDKEKFDTNVILYGKFSKK